MTKNYIFWLIITLAFILRFYKLGEVPLSLNWDEVSNAYNAYSILKTGRDEYGSLLPLTNKSFDDYKPPLYMYLSIPTIGIFGLTPLAARLPSALFGFLAVPLVYFLAKLSFEENEKGEKIALFSMFLFSILFWHLQLSRAGFEANVGLFTTVLSVVIFLYGAKKNILLLPAAVSFGIALYSYHAQRFFLPLFFIILVFLFRREIAAAPKKYSLGFILLAIVAVLSLFVLLPQKAIFSRLESSSFTAGENNEKVDTIDNFVEHKYTSIGFQYIENYLSHFSPNFLFIKGDDNLRHHIENYGMLPLFYLPIILVGGYLAFRNGSRNKFLLTLWLLLAPLPSAVAAPAPHAIRSSLVIIPIVIISAFGLNSIFCRVRKVRLIIFTASVLVAVSLAMYLHNYYTHYAVHSARDWQFGYKEAAIESKKLEDKFEKISVSEDFEQAHIFWLFYIKYDPSFYQKLGGRGQFGKYYFVQKKSDVELSKNESELFISYVDNFPQEFNVIKTIYYPDGKEFAKIGHYEQK